MYRSFANQDITIIASICLFMIVLTNILVMVFMARNITQHAEEFVYKAPLFWWGVAYRIVLNGLGIYLCSATPAAFAAHSANAVLLLLLMLFCP